MIKNKPFTRYKLDEDKRQDTITLKINPEERADLERMKKVIRQPKDSTAIKQLYVIGAKVVLRSETNQILDVLFNNTRKNKRIGITEYD